MSVQLQPNKLYFRRDGRVAGPFENHEGDKLRKEYHWLDCDSGHFYSVDGKVRYGSPKAKEDIVAEAPEAELTFTYRNWRGEIGVRRIRPGRAIFTATEWHPEKQWLLDGFDLDKVEPRQFAMKDILSWGDDGAALQQAQDRIADLERQLAEEKALADQIGAQLKIAEAALSDIGDAEREDGDDLKWCERRAAKVIPSTRAVLTAYRKARGKR